MGKLFRSREGDITAADTKTQLTTLGSESAPGPLLVPSGVRRISEIISTFASNFAAANDCAVFLRLEGPGLPEGPETVTIGGTGGAVATGGASTQKASRIPVDIPVIPANEILIFAEMPGEDVGTITAGITLVFE
jgi:hypothetical protein